MHLQIPAGVVDAIILMQWGAIGGYFVWRFVRFKKLVSLTLALMSMGWMLVGVSKTLRLIVGNLDTWLKCASIVTGGVVWYAIVRVERTGR